MKSLKTSILHSVPGILTSCGIFYFSSLPQPPFVLTSFQWQDKFLHYGAYLFYGLTLAIFFDRLTHSWKKNIMYLILWGAFYAFTDELHQYFVPGRSSEFGDWMADVLGIATASIIYSILRKKYLTASNESHSN